MTPPHPKPATLISGKQAGNKQPKVSYYKKPQELTTDQWQKELRKQIAQEQPFEITTHQGEHPVFTQYSVRNPVSGGVYTVAIRNPGRGLNFCTCMDYKTNRLGTCKHIESVLVSILKNKTLAKLLTEPFTPSYSSLFLNYLPIRHITLRIGTQNTAVFEKLAKEYCDQEYTLAPQMYDKIETLLAKAAEISPEFRCYGGAMDFIISIREKKKRERLVDELFAESTKNAAFTDLVKTTLYPYQRDGILFAARCGRCLIADEMGLGKTIQATGACELLKKLLGISSVLIVCPTSLKYQWKAEIEKFTDSSVIVIEGNPLARKKQYQQDEFYKIVSYNAVMTDYAAIKDAGFDLVILDEAQRIKNWKTKTAQQVKKIDTPYAFVLTGTPLENKLEELYSIIQFIDPFLLGPLYKFLTEHQIVDDHNKVIGYKDLNKIGELLSDIVIRRRKKDVLTQLPNRTDKNLFVPMTQQQADIHEEYQTAVSRLVSKWKRLGFLDEKDRQRLLINLNCMRMVCDSTYILDQQTRFDTKISELMAILDDVINTDSEKVVIFSQWERMTRLVAGELQARKVGFEYLHGGIPSEKRKDLIKNFHEIPNRQVFLSTDAGGLGLNLQCASLLINLDIPWNPAVLEQRIGRIHRLGQKRNVHIINLVASETIEHRMLEIHKFKSSLFGGVLDNGEDQIFMGESKFKHFMQSVDKLATQTLKPDIIEEQSSDYSPPIKTQQAAAQLFTTAAQVFGTLAQTFSTKQTTIENDALSGKSYLKIPIENQEVITEGLKTLQDFLRTIQNI